MMEAWLIHFLEKNAKLEMLLAVTIAGVGLDQYTKAWARSAVLAHQVLPVTDFLAWVHGWNYGVSFGLFASHRTWSWIFFIFFSSLWVGVFWYWALKTSQWTERWGACFMAAGALGNVIDRVRFGAVFDFICVHWGSWAFPAFNVADMLVSMGFLTLTSAAFQWKVWPTFKQGN